MFEFCLPTIFIFDRDQQELEFRDSDTLRNVIEKFSCAPPKRPPKFRPSIGRLCTAETSTLLYVDKSKTPTEVTWLDCSTSPPQPVSDRQNTQLPHNRIHDIVFLNKGKKEMLLYTCDDGVFAHNVKSSQNEWSITSFHRRPLKNPCSVTTNDRGHIFVSDTNNSVVLMFSSDGVELGTVMDPRDIARPGPICWCESLLSLVVAYEVNDKWAIVAIDLSEVI